MLFHEESLAQYRQLQRRRDWKNGIAQSRHGLSRQRYLEEKRERLELERQVESKAPQDLENIRTGIIGAVRNSIETVRNALRLAVQ